MKSHEVLRATDLSIGYPNRLGDRVVATGIDISLKNGRLISMLGPNGAGKSTLLKTLTGIHKPLSGKVMLGDNDITAVKPQQRAKRISVVLTEAVPPSNLTIYELIALGRQPYTNWLGTMTDEDRKIISEAIRLTETDSIVNNKHFQVSDGQLQKALVARAIAQDTPLIVLDEPATHLDLQHKFSLFLLLRKLASETGKCILFSTHDIELAIELSDEIIVVNKGAAIQDKPGAFLADGTFQNLFDGDQIVFDPEKVKFSFKDQTAGNR